MKIHGEVRNWFGRFRRWLVEGHLRGCGICKTRRFPSFKKRTPIDKSFEQWRRTR